MVCPKATTIPRTIRTNAGHCSQTGAKPSRNSCLRPLQTLRRSLGKSWPWTAASEFTDVKTERIERAIADDEAFLTTQPTRTKLLKQRASGSPLTQGG
jgi:hypothetical protein